MQVLTRTQSNFKLLAGFLGVLQGLTWILMGAICVALYTQDRLPTLKNYDSYMGLVQYYIYSLFIHEQFGLTFTDRFLVPNVFNICVWFHIVVNSFWALSSLNVLCNQRGMILSMRLWCFVTWMVCIWDFIMVVMLGTDYKKCLHFASYNSKKLSIEEFCANGILPVLMIAARGFILWILNIALTIILCTISTQLKQVNVRIIPSYVFPQAASDQFRSTQSQPNFQQTNAAYSQHQQNPSTSSATYFTPDSFAGYPHNSPTVLTAANKKWNLLNESRNFQNSGNDRDWGSRQAIMSGPDHEPFVLDNPARR